MTDKRTRSTMQDDEMPVEAEDGTEESTSDQAPEAAVEAGLVAEAAATAARDQVQGTLAAERDKYLRLAAEFDNYRKRNLRDRQEAGGRAQADLVQGLLEILDDIMRFAHLDPAAVDSATVVQGVAMVERKMLKALGGQGLEVVDPVGQPFDPAQHEAVATEPAASEAEDDMVARVYQAGYMFKGQLLRPARVVVKQWAG